MGISAGGDLTADAKSVILPIFKSIEKLEYRINKDGFSESSPFPELQLIGELSQTYGDLQKAVSGYMSFFSKSEMKEYNKLYGKAMKFLDKSTKRPMKTIVHVLNGCDPFVSEFRRENFDKYAEFSAGIKSNIRGKFGVSYEETEPEDDFKDRFSKEGEDHGELDDFDLEDETSVDVKDLRKYASILSRKLQGDSVKSGDISSLISMISDLTGNSGVPEDVYKPVSDAKSYLEEYVDDSEKIISREDSSWKMLRKVSEKLHYYLGDV